MNEPRENRKIIAFTGPYGSGRKTLADMAGSTLGLKEVLSYTTRPARPGENDGEDYYFISKEEFAQAEGRGEFLEAAEIFGHRYGIKGEDLERLLEQNVAVYVVVNSMGAALLKRLYPDRVIRLFIYADRERVRTRLIGRGDPEEAVNSHMAYYDEEMEYQGECEHAFENFESAHTMFALTNVLESYLARNLIDKD
ncbi:guanylate kinase [Paenibacillus gansuensis]|uniref:Guanylate kinase n=1 Tax=Paenibacillus gansuensis TaxID=306542 RepID=A0ABW5PGS1_9BACL